jgi:hypothetical protein
MTMGIYPQLRPYQTAIARAVLDSVLHRRGRIFTVEIASQGGARELSAQMELLLLALHAHSGARMVKVAQGPAESGCDRLAGYLERGYLGGLWSSQPGMVSVGNAQQHFIDPSQVGEVRGPLVLLEVANAQDLEARGYHQCLLPLAEESGATVVLYGSPWNGKSWFEQLKHQNRELAKADGWQRHFRVPWQEVARHSSLYGQYVAQQRARLGQDHPWFLTRYGLRPIPVAGPLLSDAQLRGCEGTYSRGRSRRSGVEYLASVWVSRTSRQRELSQTAAPSLAGGLTALVTIAEVVASGPGGQNTVRVVDHRWWESDSLAELIRPLAELLGKAWDCRRVVVESPWEFSQVTRQLQHMLPQSIVEGYEASPEEESAMAVALLAAVNTGRLKCYMPDGSPEHRALRHEMGSARALARPGGLLAVELQQPADGFLRGLLLLQRAATLPVSHEAAPAVALVS